VKINFFISLCFRRTLSSHHIEAKAMPKPLLFLYIAGNEEIDYE